MFRIRAVTFKIRSNALMSRGAHFLMPKRVDMVYICRIFSGLISFYSEQVSVQSFNRFS